MPNTAAQIVFTEIPAADPERACRFYETVLGAPLSESTDGPNPIWLFPHADGVVPAGHIYPGKPASDGAGPSAHFAVTDDLRDVMDRVRAGGGTVVSDIITIYSGSFFYAIDSEGNSLGIFRYIS